MNKKITVTLIIFLGIMFTSTVGGNAASLHPWRIQQVAQLPGAESNQAFGYSVAISGNTLAVGDPYDYQDGAEAGSVTIYQSDSDGNWTQVTRLTPSDPEAGIHFGRSIALSGNLLLVGAPFDTDSGFQSGSAYIFERDLGGNGHWGQVTKLTASDANINDQFGWAVALDGITAVVGAYTKTYGGRVYIFERDEGGPQAWGETAQLNPDPPGFQACFGESLDLDGDLLAVGAYGGGDYAGYAYVFQRQPASGQWQRLTRFRAADTYAYHYFGYSITLDGWTILASSPGAGGLAGAAYVFTGDPANPEIWTEQAQLTASDGEMQDYFGLQLTLAGDLALVGAPMHASEAGAVYLFSRHQGGADTWGEVTSIQGEDTTSGDQFGYWSSVEGNLVVVGAPGKLPHGSAYIFDLDPPWINHLPLVTR